MNIHNVRRELLAVLADRDLTQVDFANKYGLSYSWINKFINEQADNPRYSSLEALQKAIEKEQRQLTV